MPSDMKIVVGRNFLNPPKIPPTKNQLHQQHVKHVNYEAFVWKNALEANQEVPEAHQPDWGMIV